MNRSFFLHWILHTQHQESELSCIPPWMTLAVCIHSFLRYSIHKPWKYHVDMQKVKELVWATFAFHSSPPIPFSPLLCLLSYFSRTPVTGFHFLLCCFLLFLLTSSRTFLLYYAWNVSRFFFVLVFSFSLTYKKFAAAFAVCFTAACVFFWRKSRLNFSVHWIGDFRYLSSLASRNCVIRAIIERAC